MMNKNAFSQTLHVYLENYLASSETLRTMLEKYVHFWMSNLLPPSSDDTTIHLDQRLSGMETGLDERLNHLESRLQALDSKIDYVLRLVHEHTDQAQLAASEQHHHSAQPDSLAQLTSQMHALDEKAAHLLHLLHLLMTHPSNNPNNNR